MVANDIAGLWTEAALDPILSAVPMRAVMKWLGADERRTHEAERQVPQEVMRKNLAFAETSPILDEVADVDGGCGAIRPSQAEALQELWLEKQDADVLHPSPPLPPVLVVPPLQTGERWEPWAEELENLQEGNSGVGFMPNSYGNRRVPQNPAAEPARRSRHLDILSFASVVAIFEIMVYLLRLS